MEKLNEIIKKVVPGMNLKQSLKSTKLKRGDDCFEVSIYTGELTNEGLVNAAMNLKKAFPQLSAGFIDIFNDRIKENGYSDQRLKDAISHVIDNCVYPTPTIAQFISYDKKMKLYNFFGVLFELI